MKLTGKRIYFLGDSITEGVAATAYEKVYHQVAASLLGAKTVVDGISGTRIGKQRQPTAHAPTFDQDFVPRLQRAATDVDCAVFFGGVNDWGHGDAPFGELTDRKETTFCGSAYTLCKLLKEKFGDKAAIVLPMHNIHEENPFGEGGIKRVAGKPLRAYREVIKRFAAEFSIPTLDLWEDKQLNPHLGDNNFLYFADGLHPNDAGHAVLGERVADFLKNV